MLNKSIYLSITPTKYVCGASLCVGVLEQERAEQVQDKLCTCILHV